MERDEKRDYLVSLRESTGMTRKDFAIEYEIPYPTITDWELGHRRIPEYFLRLLAYKVHIEKARKKDFSIALFEQLAFDYCCSAKDVLDDENHFTVFSQNSGQRVFDSMDNPTLKITVINDKLLFTGKEEVIHKCKELYKDTTGPWFMDVHNFRILEELLGQHGSRIKTVHPFFIPTVVDESYASDFEIVKYSKEEIEQFRDDERFDEAFCFDEKAPDMLGIAAVKNGEIIGMAGASADSPTFWQIGINVMPGAENCHVATALVSKLKKEVLALGKTPYYGASMSNLASQRVALNSGFKPAWVELLSENI